MHQLIHSLTLSDLFKRQIPVFIPAFVIAELFYKFHSFALECIAFLVTWYVFDAIHQWASGKWKRVESAAQRSKI
jgi:hypothetical protein